MRRITIFLSCLLAISLMVAVAAEAKDKNKNKAAAQPGGQNAAVAFHRFLSGDLSKKTIVVWGNSTVAFQAAFYQTLAAHAVPGDVLAGLVVTPEGDNPDHATETEPSRNQNGHLHRLGNIINMGNNGITLRAMLAPPSVPSKPGGGVFYRIDAVCAAAPDLLIIRGPLINDVRQGQCDLKCSVGLQRLMLEKLEACTPKTDILLQIENSLLTADPDKHGYVKPELPAAVQQYSEIMRQSGLSFVGAYPNVYVMDLQEELYGVQAPAESPYMRDQLHPSPEGQKREGELVIDLLKLAKAGQ
jgi:hypothetical protein